MASDLSDESNIMILKRHEDPVPRRRTYSQKRAKPAEDPNKIILFKAELYIYKKYLGMSEDKYEDEYTDIDEIIASGIVYTMKYTNTEKHYVEKTMDITYVSKTTEIDDYWEKTITLLGCILRPVVPISIVDKWNYRAPHITLMRGEEEIGFGSIDQLLEGPKDEITP